MNNIKTFFVNLSNEIAFIPFLRKVIIGLGIIFFVTSLLNVAGMLYETRSTKGIIFAADNDAGRGIQTATLTRWWNSNHFAPYGNLYFRFAHTLAKVTPIEKNSELSELENEEVQHHFAAMLTSLFSLAGLCLFLGYLLAGKLSFTPWVATVLFHLSLFDSTWVNYLFRVHPDHTLMLFSAIAAYFTLKFTNSKNHKDFIIAALFWGTATAVKRSTVLFIPSFLYLFLSEGFNRESFKKGMSFIGYMLLSYLIIGFPQNFGFLKHINFLYAESHNSLSPNIESVTRYLGFIFDQSKYLWVALLGFHIFFGKQEKLLNKKFVIFCFIALVVLLAGNMASSSYHHVMPHVALFFVLLIFLFKNIPVIPFPKKMLGLGVVVVLTLLFLPHSEVLTTKRMEQLHCRSETISAIQAVDKFLQGPHILVRDPYFPFKDTFKKKTTQLWGANESLLDSHKATIWASRRSFLEGLLTRNWHPHISGAPTRDIWDSKLSFARKVLKDSSFTTPNGANFEKIYEDSCGYMIWKKKD